MKVTSERTYLLDIPVQENEDGVTKVVLQIPMQEFEVTRNPRLHVKVVEVHRATVEVLT